jgi:hypothetical protein
MGDFLPVDNQGDVAPTNAANHRAFLRHQCRPSLHLLAFGDSCKDFGDCFRYWNAIFLITIAIAE